MKGIDFANEPNWLSQFFLVVSPTLRNKKVKSFLNGLGWPLLSTAPGVQPRSVLKTLDTAFPNIDLHTGE